MIHNIYIITIMNLTNNSITTIILIHKLYLSLSMQHMCKHANAYESHD